MNTPAGTILYDYKLPVKGVSKKVIYHISDIHLNCSDDPAAVRQPLTYENWLKGWPWFSIRYQEPCTESQMKLPEEHLACLLELAREGDAIVFTGDICDKVSSANLDILDEQLSKVEKPWIAVCGNHDLAADIPDDCLYARVKEPVQVLDLGDLIIVGVDNSQRQVTKDQTARLLEVLALGKPVIVTLHVPIMTEDKVMDQRLRMGAEGHGTAAAAPLQGHLPALFQQRSVADMNPVKKSQGKNGFVHRFSCENAECKMQNAE